MEEAADALPVVAPDTVAAGEELLMATVAGGDALFAASTVPPLSEVTEETVLLLPEGEVPEGLFIITIGLLRAFLVVWMIL